jgi:uncharacterized protein (TIGR02266 family)
VKKKTILLADDTLFFLVLEKSFLSRDDFDVRTAGTGTEVLDSIKTDCPDIVFLDMFMPEMNGDECCRMIKSNPATCHLPVIMVMLSGKGDDLENCRQAGCDDIILKPINREHFIETAKKYLNIPIRTNPRYRARLKIHLERDTDTVLTEYSINLSTGGVFLETMDLIEENTPLSAEFILPNNGITIQCHAQVAWVNHPDDIKNPNLPVGMGIRFIDPAQETLDAIRNYIQDENLSPMW